VTSAHSNPSAAVDVMAQVVRYDRRRLRMAQALVPLAVLAAIASRYAASPTGWTLAAAAQLAAGGCFLFARRGLGWSRLTAEGGALGLGGAAWRIKRGEVGRWTISGGKARLYGQDVSWKLRVHENPEALRGLLASLFGPPIPLHRRGSLRQRTIALAVCLLGVLITALTIAFAWPIALIFLGIPCALLGFGVFAAFTQRARRE
jgi:hypothetical protein